MWCGVVSVLARAFFFLKRDNADHDVPGIRKLHAMQLAKAV